MFPSTLNSIQLLEQLINLVQNYVFTIDQQTHKYEPNLSTVFVSEEKQREGDVVVRELFDNILQPEVLRVRELLEDEYVEKESLDPKDESLPVPDFVPENRRQEYINSELLLLTSSCPLFNPIAYEGLESKHWPDELRELEDDYNHWRMLDVATKEECKNIVQPEVLRVRKLLRAEYSKEGSLDPNDESLPVPNFVLKKRRQQYIIAELKLIENPDCPLYNHVAYKRLKGDHWPYEILQLSMDYDQWRLARQNKISMELKSGVVVHVGCSNETTKATVSGTHEGVPFVEEIRKTRLEDGSAVAKRWIKGDEKSLKGGAILMKGDSISVSNLKKCSSGGVTLY